MHSTKNDHATQKREFYVRAYLRASTDEQNAERAKNTLTDFINSHNLSICKYYVENASGNSLDRVVLNELIEDSYEGDILLIEDIDRLTRLNYDNWKILLERINNKKLNIVVVNVPTTHVHLDSKNSLMQEDFMLRIMTALNTMMLEIVSASARRDYIMRKERQKQGIARAKAEGKYQGRKPNYKKYKQINKLLEAGFSYREIQSNLKCASNTIKEAKRWKAGR